jgi:hypothetical protein
MGIIAGEPCLMSWLHITAVTFSIPGSRRCIVNPPRATSRASPSRRAVWWRAGGDLTARRKVHSWAQSKRIFFGGRTEHLKSD